MYLASVRTDPEEFVLPTRSLPARSTKCNFERRIRSDPTPRASKEMEKIQWDRDDAYRAHGE